MANGILGKRGWETGELKPDMEKDNTLTNLGLNGNKDLQESEPGGCENL